MRGWTAERRCAARASPLGTAGPKCWAELHSLATSVAVGCVQVGNARFATGHFLEAGYLFKFMATSNELQVRGLCKCVCG